MALCLCQQQGDAPRERAIGTQALQETEPKLQRSQLLPTAAHFHVVLIRASVPEPSTHVSSLELPARMCRFQCFGSCSLKYNNMLPLTCSVQRRREIQAHPSTLRDVKQHRTGMQAGHGIQDAGCTTGTSRARAGLTTRLEAGGDGQGGGGSPSQWKRPKAR